MKTTLIMLFVLITVFLCNYQVNITRDGCGVSKLCVETPDDCDPSSNGTCLFASVIASTPTAPGGSDLTMQLRGYSMGYVALGLTHSATEVTQTHTLKH